MLKSSAKALGAFASVTVVCASAGASAAPIAHVAGSPFTFAEGSNSNTTAVSPDGRFLFVGNQFSSTITVLDVASDGSLTFQGIYPTLDSPSGMVTDPAGQHLYVSGLSQFIDAFDIAADGSLRNRRSTDLGFLSAALNAIAYVHHPGDEDFVYVNNDLSSQNSVSAFAVQPDGSLVLFANYATGGDGSGGGYYGAPRLVFARLDRLYAVNQGSNSVTVFNVASDGTLTRAGSPFSLGIFSSGAVAINPAGDALFAGQFSGSIARYPIAADGSIGAGQSTETGIEGAIVGLEVHPDGSLLVAASPVGLSGAIAVIDISGDSMQSTAGSPFENDAGLTGGAAGVEIDPRGEFLFIGNASGTTSVSVWRFVEQNRPPAAHAGANQVVEATAASTHVTLDGSGSTDPDGDALTFAWTENGAAIATGPVVDVSLSLGTHAITLTVTDSHGASSTAQVVVTVQDTTPPTLALSAPVTAEATGPFGARIFYGVSANDIVDGGVAPQCSPISGATFPLGDTRVDCVAVDGHGNASGGNFMVTVRDTSPPVLALPADLSAEATGPDGATVSYTATAFDLVSLQLSVSCSSPSDGRFALGTTHVSCHATDAAGNMAFGGFSVTVVDTTPPTLFGVPTTIVAEATGPTGAAVAWTPPTALDLVDGSTLVVCDHAAGATYPLGTTKVSCTSADSHGNTGSATFQVSVTFGFDGFLPPLRADGSSLFKLGRTVPVKFRLVGPSAGIVDARAELFVAKLTDGVEGTEEIATSTSAATSGNLFRYDPDGAQYIFNLATEPLTVGTWIAMAKLGDGIVHVQKFSLRQ